MATPPKKEYPGPFQRKVLWGAVTGLSIVLIGAVAVFLIWIMMRVLGFLQPVLVPIAVAGIMAYLLEPLIRRLTNRGWRRSRAMLAVYCGFHLTIIILATMVVVPAVRQADQWFEKRDTGEVAESVRALANKAFGSIDRLWEKVSFNPSTESRDTDADAATDAPEESPAPAPEEALSPPPAANSTAIAVAEPAEPLAKPSFSSKEWLHKHTETLIAKAGAILGGAFSGFLGLFGYFVGFFLVPIYLYYFLKESEGIKQSWSDYLPLKESKFKNEVVSTLNEINGYLIAFFRGQMLVSLIDGLLVGLCLKFIGLPGGLLIGIFVALLGLLPYIGSLVCWLPAVIISITHFGQTASGPGGVKGAQILDPATGEVVKHYVNTWSLFPDQIWIYPIIVSAIFVVVQQVNSFVTQPKIVGDSVGLHPLTVIFSVIFWSLLIGGFLGVLLAVPLTASLKVLFRRYVWEKRLHQKVKPQDAPAG